jgi:large subunit ribosomal protein L32
MPNPKRRHSNSRTRMRRAHQALKAFVPNQCARCGATQKPHRVCDNCGYYGFERGSDKKGSEVLPKDDF